MRINNIAIPASYIFLEKDGKFLIARRCNTGYEDGKYQVPAGHVEKDEMPSQAIIREAREEVGIDIDPKDLKLFHFSYRIKHDITENRADFFFRTDKWKGEIRIMEPDKCDEIKWVSPDELPDNVTLHVKIAFESLRDGTVYREISPAELKAAGLYKL